MLLTETGAGRIRETHAYVEVDQLDLPRWNLRVGRDSNFRELVFSIRDNGLQQPLVVRPIRTPRGQSPRYEVIAGRRRLEAIKWLLRHEPESDWSPAAPSPRVIPVIIREIADVDAILWPFHDDGGRRDWSPYEVFLGIKAVVDTIHRKVPGASQTTIARQTGIPQSMISQALIVLRELTPERLIAAGLRIQPPTDSDQSAGTIRRSDSQQTKDGALGAVDYDAVRQLSYDTLLAAARAETTEKRNAILRSSRPRRSATMTVLARLSEEGGVTDGDDGADSRSESEFGHEPSDVQKWDNRRPGAPGTELSLPRQEPTRASATRSQASAERRSRMKQTATSDAEVAEIAEGTFNLVNNGDPYRGARFQGMPSTLPRERLGGLIGSYAGTLIALAKGTGQLAAAPVVVEIPGYRVIVERAEGE